MAGTHVQREILNTDPHKENKHHVKKNEVTLLHPKELFEVERSG